MRPNYEHLTPLERFDSSAKYLREMGEAGSKHSQQYTHRKLKKTTNKHRYLQHNRACNVPTIFLVINQHVLAIQRVAQTDLQDINNETINGLSEAASKRVLGLAIKTVVYQRKQMLFYADNKEASERIGSVFSRQRTAWMNKTCEIEQELLRRKLATITLN